MVLCSRGGGPLPTGRGGPEEGLKPRVEASVPSRSAQYSPEIFINVMDVEVEQRSGVVMPTSCID